MHGKTDQELTDSRLEDKTLLSIPNFIPLQTTPELYAAVAEGFLGKTLLYDPHKGMDFDPPTSPEYAPHVAVLQGSGRIINATVRDGNCLFRSLSKGLLGMEKYHHSLRTTLFGFIYANSKFFLTHLEQRYKCNIDIKEYCLSMDRNGVWGTDIEILAAATMLQIPVYTYTSQRSEGSYNWIRFHPLSAASSLVCDYHKSIQRLVIVTKPPDYHIELFHLSGYHYDVIVSDMQECGLSFPPLSDFTCDIVC